MKSSLFKLSLIYFAIIHGEVSDSKRAKAIAGELCDNEKPDRILCRIARFGGESIPKELKAKQSGDDKDVESNTAYVDEGAESNTSYVDKGIESNASYVDKGAELNSSRIKKQVAVRHIDGIGLNTKKKSHLRLRYHRRQIPSPHPGPRPWPHPQRRPRVDSYVHVTSPHPLPSKTPPSPNLLLRHRPRPLESEESDESDEDEPSEFNGDDDYDTHSYTFDEYEPNELISDDDYNTHSDSFEDEEDNKYDDDEDDEEEGDDEDEDDEEEDADSISGNNHRSHPQAKADLRSGSSSDQSEVDGDNSKINNNKKYRSTKFGQYFVYVNCNSCKVLSRLIVGKKEANIPKIHNNNDEKLLQPSQEDSQDRDDYSYQDYMLDSDYDRRVKKNLDRKLFNKPVVENKVTDAFKVLNATVKTNDNETEFYNNSSYSNITESGILKHILHNKD
ncbi:MATH and LRR domain-containing protein PFE0570w-like [Parasteatoda tepidariorum]|uniref:MATH and LRR domain-containing protein PFE0570w-like n=1 Tax=Parasteatoda tepidariorum TaxID=114398 RepID=UPI001C71941C|nr:putative uncharacterized protein DDB_G0272194 [Parasteatoda tepidariorum]